MKNIIILFLTIVTITITAQTPYDKGMQKGFEYWQKGESDKAIATFDRIGQAEKTNWIPYYYAANVGITSSFGERDKNKKEVLMENAAKYIDMALNISPDNSELYTLKGLLFTAIVSSNPMVNGPKYSGETMEIYNKAIQLDTTNPRPIYLRGQFQMGAAKFFKQDLQPFCKEVENSIDKFDNFTPKGKYYPKWGKDRAEAILIGRDCKVNSEELIKDKK